MTTETIGRHAATYSTARDGCTAHDAGAEQHGKPCGEWCVWSTYVGRHDDSRARIAWARKARMHDARRAFAAGAVVVVSERPEGEEIAVWPSTTRHTRETTSWDELAGMVRMWRGRYPRQTFYVVPEVTR
jgi:hypothetical protein